MKQQSKLIRMVVAIALFTALSAIGAMIKIPNPVTSSIALDSTPAFLISLVLGGIPGALVAFLGHLLSAAAGGFPLSLPIHLIVAVEMGLIMLAFSWIARKINEVLAVIVAVLLNGVLAPAAFLLIPGLGMPFFLVALPLLTAAGLLNAILAALIYRAIRNTGIIKAWKENGHGL